MNNASIQYVNKKAKENADKIGDLTALQTTDKDSVVEAVNELFQDVDNGKTVVAAAVTDKGIPTSADATFQQIADNVRAIQTGITPTESINITQNGTYDVTDKAQAVVNVSGQAPTLKTKNITANGTYNASDDNADGYSQVNVNVPAPTATSKVYKITVSSDVSGTWLTVNPGGDADIAAHRNDSSFAVAWISTTPCAASSTRCGVTANNLLVSSDTAYGMYGRSSATAMTGVKNSQAMSSTTATAGATQVTASGEIKMYASSTYKILAGTYTVLCGW